MGFKIGFSAEEVVEEKAPETEIVPAQTETSARCSLVQVEIEGHNTALAYYNDKFDLHCGDIVYVDGKFEGRRGRVVGVEYNFRIRLSDYKRVIAVADTKVSGQLYFCGSHVMTFDRNVLPREKIAAWFKAPSKPEDEIAVGHDDDSFPLQAFLMMGASPEIAQRGKDYYSDSRVRYLCLDGTKGYALVEGTHMYEVEFTYQDGEVSDMVCDCYCVGVCKHEFAAMLQLRETLHYAEDFYGEQFGASGYFAAVCKPSFFALCLDPIETGSLVL